MRCRGVLIENRDTTEGTSGSRNGVEVETKRNSGGVLLGRGTKHFPDAGSVRVSAGSLEKTRTIPVRGFGVCEL